MNTIDYVYRFDPKNPSVKSLPPDAEVAKQRLEEGNQMFAAWMESCRVGSFSSSEQPRYIVQCNGVEVGMVRTEGQLPKQMPFAVVVGCSDARVPTEMIFGQGFNDLFVIRVAGNVLGDECLGSVGFALNVLSESVKVMVMLGHSRCGAVTAAVDSYLQPLKFWSKSTPNTLRLIMQRLYMPVREAANGLKEVWGTDVRNRPGYREALIESAVLLNAAQTAYDLRTEVERAGKWEIEVLWGAYNLFTHKVGVPIPAAEQAGSALIENSGSLAFAPSNPREFSALSARLAEAIMPLMQYHAEHPSMTLQDLAGARTASGSPIPPAAPATETAAPTEPASAAPARPNGAPPAGRRSSRR
ncbi:MAG TPA: carbonic anhydrase [Pirellulales bacterium]|jgi:carbonic anhydrase|nr:carbonic anhydrase [Pirellulales bacterium]